MDTAAESVEQTPLIVEHEERTVDQGQTPDSDGLSELEQYKKDRDAGKAQPEPTDKTEKVEKPEPAKPEKWQDPDTGDTYDMRHKVAKRVKTLLDDRHRERTGRETAEQRAASLEEENRELRKILMQGGATPQQAKAGADRIQADADAEPDPGDTQKYPEGQFDKAFIRDMARWGARQETKQFAETTRTQQQEEARQAAEIAQLSEWQGTLPEARKRYADFDQVLERIPNTPENAPIVKLMMGSPVGNDVVYVLGTQPEAMEAYRRAPNQESRMRLLYHIEAQLIQHHRSQATQQKPTRTTNAPAPVSPVQPGPAAQGVDWSRTDDPDQYARWKAQRQARR